MDIDFSILNGIFSKITDIKDNLTSTDTNKPLSARQGKILNEIKINTEDIEDNLTSTDTNKPLSAKQGKILNEIKMSPEDYLYIDTVDAEITYDDDSTDTIPILADIREVNDILKVAIVWNDNYNENSTRPSSVTMELLRDDVLINNSDYVLNSDNNWQYKVNVPFDDGQGNSYSYSWRVMGVSGYINTIDYDGNLGIVTLTSLSGNAPPTPGGNDSSEIPERT